MKALLSVEPGEPGTLQLGDVAEPRVGAGQLRVRVLGCSRNRHHVEQLLAWWREGRIHAASATLQQQE